MVLDITLRCLIHLEFFVYDVKKCSDPILLRVDTQLDTQFFQHRLLKRSSFLDCILLPSLSEIN